ncbi:glutamine synthetase [Bradyrhizobium sp. AZCC 1578]
MLLGQLSRPSFRSCTTAESVSSFRSDSGGGVFDDDFIDSFIELKMTEVERFEMTPHPVEFEMYYSQ